MRLRTSACRLACACVIALPSAAALAQTQTEPMLPVPPLPVAPNLPAAPAVPLERGLTVVDRQRPEVSPIGFRAGEFFFFPRAELDEAYNDNITAAKTGAKGDFITALVPSFDLRSNFGTHALNLSAGAVLSHYASTPRFDTQDAFANADGRLDVDNTHDFRGAVNIARLHEDPGAPTVPGNAARPVKYTTYSGTAGFEQTRLRVGYSADLTARREEYEAVPGIATPALVPQSDRNNNAYELALRGSYEFVPNYQGFLRGAANIRDYDHAAIGAPARNSHGYRIDAGARIDLTGVTYIEAYAGWLEQDYNSPLLGSISGPDIGANLVWNATQLTSISFKAERTIADAPAFVAGGTVPGYFHSTAGVNVDHELLRNLLLNGHVTYANDDFHGADRTDNDYLFGVGAKYLMIRNFYVGGTYTLEHRDSSGRAAINPFTRNIVMLRLSAQY
jgi:hypothetical protein